MNPLNQATTSFPAGLVSWPERSCLLSQLAHALSAVPTDLLPNCLVVLPTKRARLILEAKLAANLKALLLPQILTWDEFLSSRSSNASLATAELELVAMQMLRHSSFKYIGPTHLHEVLHIFLEMRRHQVTLSQVEQVLSDFLVSLSARYDASELEIIATRYRELCQLLQTFTDGFDKPPIRPRECDNLDHASTLLTHLQDTLPHYHYAYFAGFTSLPKAYHPLLKRLGSLKNVGIWLSSTKASETSDHPLELLHELLAEVKYTPETALEAANTDTHVSTNFVHRLPSVHHETEEAVRLVKQYLRAGVPASQIAILLTSEERYRHSLNQGLEEAGVNANVAIARPLSQTSFGQFWQRLLATIEQPTLIHWYSFLQHPLSTLLCPLGDFSSPTLAAWEELSERFKKLPLNSEPHTWKLAALNIHPTFQLWQQWFSEWPSLTAPCFTEQWLSKITPVMEKALALESRNALLPDLSHDELQRCKDQLRAYMEHIQLLQSQGPREFILQDLLLHMRTRLLAAEVREAGDPLCGVQVLSVTEARYIPFTVMVILGCIEGEFPKKLPQDQLISDQLKNRLGLPGWNYLEALENTTFQLLAARPTAFHLLFPEVFGGSAVAPSRFLKFIPAKPSSVFWSACSNPYTPIAEATSDANQSSAIENSSSIVASSWDPFAIPISASNLKMLLHCPYAFSLHQKGIRDTGIPTERDRSDEGQWYHEVLAALITGVSKGHTPIPPLKECVLPVAELEDFLRRRCEDILAVLPPPPDMPLSWYEHFRTTALPKYLDTLKLLYGAQLLSLKKSQREILLSAGALMKSDIPLHFHGRVDAIDECQGTILITDFKSKTIPTLKDVTALYEPQLIFYAWLLSLKETSPSEQIAFLNRTAFGYFSIEDGSFKLMAAGASVKARAQDLGWVSKYQKVLPLEELVLSLSQRIESSVQQIKDTGYHFAATPNNLCERCSFAAICRVGLSWQKERQAWT